MSLACCDQLSLPSRTNTYADPEFVPLSSSKMAPTSAVFSPNDTERPNESFALASAVVSLACCDQLPLPSRTNTYADPEFVPL